MTIRDSLAQVQELLGRATPGEWRVSGECVIFDDRRLVCCGRGRYECCGEPDVDGAEHPIVGLLGGNPNLSDIEAVTASVNWLREHGHALLAMMEERENG